MGTSTKTECFMAQDKWHWRALMGGRGVSSGCGGGSGGSSSSSSGGGDNTRVVSCHSHPAARSSRLLCNWGLKMKCCSCFLVLKIIRLPHPCHRSSTFSHESGKVCFPARTTTDVKTVPLGDCDTTQLSRFRRRHHCGSASFPFEAASR
jgi:hypothetical protein